MKLAAYTKTSAPAEADFTTKVSFEQASASFKGSAGYTKIYEQTGTATAAGTATAVATLNTAYHAYSYPTKGNILSTNKKQIDSFFKKQTW